MVFSVAMTDPTVAPMPQWASGMSATGPARMGSRDVRSAWSRALSSRSVAQEIRVSVMVVGMVVSLSRRIFVPS